MKNRFDTMTILLCVVFVLQTFSLQIANSQTIQKKYSGTAETNKPKNNSATPLPGGTYSIGTTGTYPSIDDAFASLSINGILGSVTFLLIDTLYDATANMLGSYKLVGPIAGAGPDSRITIRPADNTAVTTKGNGEAVLQFINVSYCTVDGIGVTGNTRLNIQAFSNQNFWSNSAIEFWGNCDFIEIKNITAGTTDIGRGSFGVGITPDNSGSPDSCKISGVSVTSADRGILVQGDNGLRAKGNIIRNNKIGSSTDSLFALGILVDYNEGLIIENNHIENLRCTSQNYQMGIGVQITRNAIIRNNIVHNLLQKSASASVIAILTTGVDDVHRVSNNWIYNNKVWDITTNISAGSSVRGIAAWYQDSVRIDYNSVNLTESGDVNPANGSNALRITATNIYPMVRNNILINTRDDSPGISTAMTMLAPQFLSDYNNLSAGSGASSYIAMTSSYYKTIENWKATGSDIHSVSVYPKFCNNILHIDTTDVTSNSLEGKGIPIAGIAFDFEGQPRNTTTPDIGADEFVKVLVGVEEKNNSLPTVFALEQNYPNPFNPSTVISYQLPVNSLVSLKIYDLLGREIATIVKEEQSAGWKEVEWNASAFSSGIYFYKLQAGDFIGVKKMSMIK